MEVEKFAKRLMVDLPKTNSI